MLVRVDTAAKTSQNIGFSGGIVSVLLFELLHSDYEMCVLS